MKSQAHGSHLRKGRVSEAGRVYLLTMVTKNRRRVFADFAAARVAVCCLHSDAVRKSGQILAFVVMPDHVHWLLALGQKASVSGAVRVFRAKVSLALGEKIWQKGFYDRGLRAEEDVAAVARYIIANPLRAGLVDSVGDYPHWDAVWL
ncbi:MAG: transposase [Gammaproteobacteria bacterium HGW-Gammaproteobacteria-3]|nr:MAG: transposase [Gammaproteobacteria bacterium HGW-Gammaproteobacteria-3]